MRPQRHWLTTAAAWAVACVVAGSAGPLRVTAAASAITADELKSAGWNVSELRTPDGKIVACYITRHYTPPPEGRNVMTALMAGRGTGLSLLLADSSLKLADGAPLEATFTIGGKPFTGFSARVRDKDEIGIYPDRGTALLAAIEHDGLLDFRSSAVALVFPFDAGAVSWLRACARRNGIAIEPDAQQ
jgi:hypothetical protein